MCARILVIEDNTTNLELMTYLLRAFGHSPLVARTGEEGIGSVERDRPDLVICDIQLPGIEGYEVVRHLKSRPDLLATPVVAVTALAMAGDREKALAAGFDGYISKPIAPETFVQQLDGFLRSEKRSTPVAPVPTASTPAPAPAKRTSILVADDSAINRDLIRSTLEPLGYRVAAAESVEAALALAEREPFDLILSDLNMPGSGGYDFIKAAKASPRLRAIPFLVITSSVWGNADRARSMASGAAGFIMRPIEPGQLLQQIEACLPAREDD